MKLIPGVEYVVNITSVKGFEESEPVSGSLKTGNTKEKEDSTSSFSGSHIDGSEIRDERIPKITETTKSCMPGGAQSSRTYTVV